MKKIKIWNKGRVIGPKPPLTVEDINLIRGLLSQADEPRDLVLFCLAVDTSFRASDLVKLRVMDVMGDSQVFEVVRIVQSKTGKAMAGFVTALTRKHILNYIALSGKCATDYLFTSKRAGNVQEILEILRDTFSFKNKTLKDPDELLKEKILWMFLCWEF